jgi:hypothetical protein
VSHDHNKRLVHRLVEIRDFESIDEVATGQIARDARHWVGAFRESFPDFQMELLDVIAEGDKVVGYFKCSGTHDGEWRGPAPHLPRRQRQARLSARGRGRQPQRTDSPRCSWLGREQPELSESRARREGGDTRFSRLRAGSMRAAFRAAEGSR